MSLTVLGYILIPLGIILLVACPEFLLYLTIAFAGFSGSAVLIIGGDLGIQPSYYFIILWMIRNVLGRNRFRIKFSAYRENKWLCIFIGISTLSIFMPLIIAKGITIMNVDGEIVLSHFTRSNITQLIYLWFCFLFFIFIYRVISQNSYENNMKLVNWYIYGVMLVCLVSFYQIIAIRQRLPFDILFRQNVHGNVQGTRIYGPCIEASMLCYYLVSALPICIRWKKNALSWTITLVNIILGIYSFSSTYIVGIILWIGLEFAHKVIRQKKINKKYIATILILFPILILGIINIQDYIVVAWQKLLDTFKQKNISGVQRNYSLKLLIAAFFKSPILGVGFGSCRGNDLFTTWLACVGIVGMIPIIIFVCEKVFKTKCPIEYQFANILIWVAMLMSVPEPYNLFVWMLLAFTKIDRKQMIKKESLNSV